MAPAVPALGSWSKESTLGRGQTPYSGIKVPAKMFHLRPITAADVREILEEESPWVLKGESGAFLRGKGLGMAWGKVGKRTRKPWALLCAKLTHLAARLVYLTYLQDSYVMSVEPKGKGRLSHMTWPRSCQRWVAGLWFEPIVIFVVWWRQTFPSCPSAHVM